MYFTYQSSDKIDFYKETKLHLVVTSPVRGWSLQNIMNICISP